MKKILFMALLVICAAVCGRETQASARQATMDDEPCFISSSSLYYCSANDIYINGYGQDNGLYYYYAWQCSSFSCPL